MLVGGRWCWIARRSWLAARTGLFGEAFGVRLYLNRMGVRKLFQRGLQVTRRASDVPVVDVSMNVVDTCLQLVIGGAVTLDADCGGGGGA